MRIVEMMGNRIKELRVENKLTQAELGERFGTTQDTISLWERGLRAPNVEMIYKLAKFFNVSINYLFGEEEI